MKTTTAAPIGNVAAMIAKKTHESTTSKATSSTRSREDRC